jgi:hypothetical protein
MPPEDSGFLLNDLNENVPEEPVLGEYVNPDPAAINIENILPEGTKRTRRVRFNLPKLI